MRAITSWALALLLVSSASATLQTQALEQRILASNADSLDFEVPSRPGVCGDGRSWLQIDGDAWYGTINDRTRQSPCERGPLRIVVVKSGRDVLRVRSHVGPLPPAAERPAARLGAISPAEALAFFSGLALRGEGRPASEAVTALGIADSANVTPALREVLTTAARPRELRRSAASWLVRREGGSGPVVDLLARLARDQEEHASFRQSMVGQLARLEGGVPVLIELTGSDNDMLLARQAAEALARSGDPRARRAVRELVTSDKASAEVRAAALSGMGSEYGTVQDAQVVMRAWPGMTTDKLRDAALGVIAATGGAEGRAFLLRLVRDEAGVSRQRRRAASLLDRAGVAVKEVISTYDQVSDGELRGQLIDVMASAGTREATAKLVAIAKDDTQLAARRRAISALGRTDDPAVRSALQGMVTR